MILIERTHWPLVVVGAVPSAPDRVPSPRASEDDALWASEDLRLAVVIRGDHARVWLAQVEVFAWLSAHRARLWRCASRVAWIFEDEPMRQSAERWLALVGDRLFRADTMTFCSARAAIAWLACDGRTSGDGD